MTTRAPWPFGVRSGAAGVAGAVLRAAFVAYVVVLVVLPIAVLVVRGVRGGPAAFLAAVTQPSAVDALQLSLATAALAAFVNGVVGTAVAWVIVRFDVPGRAVVSALVDLPMAIPTLVAGLVIVALYGPAGALGPWFVARDLPIAFARPGIVLALLFVTLPFVVRAVTPVLAELDPAEEEAALTLGASRWTTFRRVLLPPLLPAIAAGVVQTFARSVAEFGSLATVSGNIPGRTLVAPVWILGEVEGGDVDAAAAMSVVLLALALALQVGASRLARRVGGPRG